MRRSLLIAATLVLALSPQPPAVAQSSGAGGDQEMKKLQKSVGDIKTLITEDFKSLRTDLQKLNSTSCQAASIEGLITGELSTIKGDLERLVSATKAVSDKISSLPSVSQTHSPSAAAPDLASQLSWGLYAMACVIGIMLLLILGGLIKVIRFQKLLEDQIRALASRVQAKKSVRYKPFRQKDDDEPRIAGRPSSPPPPQPPPPSPSSTVIDAHRRVMAEASSHEDEKMVWLNAFTEDYNAFLRAPPTNTTEFDFYAKYNMDEVLAPVVMAEANAYSPPTVFFRRFLLSDSLYVCVPAFRFFSDATITALVSSTNREKAKRFFNESFTIEWGGVEAPCLRRPLLTTVEGDIRLHGILRLKES